MKEPDHAEALRVELRRLAVRVRSIPPGGEVFLAKALRQVADTLDFLAAAREAPATTAVAEVPAPLKTILDTRAGKDHSAQGPVMACLAEILTAHEAMLRARWYRELFGDPAQPPTEPARRDTREDIAGAFLDRLTPDELVQVAGMAAARAAAHRGGPR